MDVKYHRYLLSLLNQESHKKRVRLILGARQTGKTTLFSLLKDKNDILIDLQDRSERLRFFARPIASYKNSSCY
jgi:predicted AAA+ superfamily ATPase